MSRLAIPRSVLASDGPMRSLRGFVVVLALTIAWGVLSFGAVYPWAFTPLLLSSGILGVWGVVATRTDGARPRPVMLGLVLMAVAVCLQLVPLPRSALARISPETDAFLQSYDLGYAAKATAGATRGGTITASVQSEVSHATSISPADTQVGLCLVIVFGTLMLGVAGIFSRIGVHRFVRALMVIGVVVALIGIVERAVYNGKIYGFWQTTFGGDPFGPFVNRNHFAGWMLMTLSVAIGFFWGKVARGMRGVKPGWRSRFLWFASQEANETILVGFAILVMGLSLVMTFSRSGIFCFAGTILLSGLAVARKGIGRSRLTLALAYLACLLFLSVGWVGLEAVLTRFAESSGSGFNGRVGAWGDASSIARRFPLVGTGLNTYGTATIAYQTYDLSVHYAEAHNDYLQLAVEGGLLLAIPALIVVVSIVREIRHRFREDADDTATYWIRVGATTGLAAIGLQEFFEFSLQMPGNAALCVVLCAIAVHSPCNRRGLVRRTGSQALQG